MCINNPGHMTKRAAMPMYGKNPLKIFFFRTGGSISKKLGMKHRWLKYYNHTTVYDPVMTLTFLRQGQHRSPIHLNRENF